MIKTKISAVSYINSYPFVYGLQQPDLSRYIKLSFDHPAKCAERLIKNEVDIGLVPVIALQELHYYEILSGYCIGAVNNVQTVVLLSNSDPLKINTVYLDRQSRSSNMLCKVLARHYWKKELRYKLNPEDAPPVLADNEASIVIGDRVFQYKANFNHHLDLSKEWFDFSGYPFVFAVWASNKPLNPDIKSKFEKAIEYGMGHIDKAIETLGKDFQKDILKDYYTKNISYIFDSDKKAGMEFFLKLAETI